MLGEELEQLLTSVSTDQLIGINKFLDDKIKCCDTTIETLNHGARKYRNSLHPQDKIEEQNHQYVSASDIADNYVKTSIIKIDNIEYLIDQVGILYTYNDNTTIIGRKIGDHVEYY